MIKFENLGILDENFRKDNEKTRRNKHAKRQAPATLFLFLSLKN
ncbi:hypothetical protein [Butyrivibrio sp. AE3003]|nr:hypothetical protein [Butyrivibrio sp. AE3003]